MSSNCKQIAKHGTVTFYAMHCCLLSGQATVSWRTGLYMMTDGSFSWWTARSLLVSGQLG